MVGRGLATKPGEAALLHRFTTTNLYVLFVALLCAPPLASMAASTDPGVLRLSPHTTQDKIEERALIRPDPAGKLDPEKLLSSDDGFRPFDRSLNDEAPPLWLKLKLKEPAGFDRDHVLLVKRRFFQRLVVYAPTADGGHQHTSSGVDEYQPTTMFGHWYVFPFNLGQSDSGELLVHVKVIQGSLSAVDMAIEDAQTFEEHRASSLWAYGLYFGAMLALIFYNLILYLNLRTPGHRLYVTAMTCVIFLMGLNSGLLQEYLPEFLQMRWPLPLLTMHCLVAAATARFFQVFVNSRFFVPTLHLLVRWIIYFNLALGGVTLISPITYSVPLALVIQPLGTLSMLVLLFSSLRAGIKGSRSGYVFFVAWSAFSIGAILWSLLSFDVIRRVPAAEYSLYIGSIMEAMVLALGLSYRVGQLRTQRNRALREQQKAARLANVDSLTGAYNRRFIENYLDGLLDSEDRRAFQGSLIMLDIDNFKPVNDEFGHAAGDAVLQEMTRRCMTVLRTEDVLARLGGDEFAIVLPDQSGDQARTVAEKIRHSICDEPFVFGMQPIWLSISIGIITSFEPGATSYSAFKHADKSLYEAKRAGRNRVFFTTGGAEPSPARQRKVKNSKGDHS